MPVQFLLSMKQQIANMLANHIAEFNCDDTIFHCFAFANDLAFIYLWKHNNNTLL